MTQFLGPCVDELRVLIKRLMVDNPTHEVPQISVDYLREKYPEDFDCAYAVVFMETVRERAKEFHRQEVAVREQLEINKRLEDTGVEIPVVKFREPQIRKKGPRQRVEVY